MSTNTVVVGCKLPHGLVIKGMLGQSILLNGMNTSVVLGGHGITHVDADEWAVWSAIHADFAPIKSGAIFTHNTASVADLHDMGTDLQDEVTGFEGLNPDKPVKGLKPEDKQAKTGGELRPPKAVKKAQDAAARAAAATMAGA